MGKLNDIRGLATTAASRPALDLYETALLQMQSYVGDPVATINSAIAEDPDFVMAHCLCAYAGCTMADGYFSGHISASVSAAEALADKANDREKRHIAASRAWLDGNFKQASEILETVLVDYPRDALALIVSHLFDFYLGDTQNLRDRVARVLPSYDENTPGYGFALGMHAFGLEECNEYSRAEQTGRRAVEICPGDVWAIHAVAHVLEMQGRQDDGIIWYQDREQDWAPDNGFAVHNWWHLALYYLDLQRIDRVLEIYDTSISECVVALEMLDASALLWRLHLMNENVGSRWEILADKWETAISWGGYYCFNDVHAMMAFVATERNGAADELTCKLEYGAGRDNWSGMMIREVGLPVSRAIRDFGAGHYSNAVRTLAKVRYTANKFGGSHAQRDIIVQTLIESARLSGQYSFARALLAERASNKAASPGTWKQTARVLKALQCHEESRRAANKAASLLQASSFA